MFARNVRFLCCLLAALCLAPSGCKSQAPAEQEPAPSPSTEASEEAALELERLRALGYVDYAEEPAEAEESGVTAYDESRAYPGYNLYTIRPLGRAELVDNEGNLLHAWHEEEERAWRRSLLLDSGDLLVVGGLKPDVYVLRLTWDSEVVWRIPLRSHHDIRPTPDGKFITFTMEDREISAINPAIPVRDNSLVIFDPPGEEVESLSLYEAIAASPDVLTFKPVPESKGVIDLVHANSMRFMTHRKLVDRDAIYDPGNLIICMRNQDSVAVVDWDRRKLVWAWGQGVLEAPHDATVLESGNLLIFDNGVRRRWSRVVEMDPQSGEIVWEYQAPERADFFTESRGGAQRLPNGNTLITESNQGHAFEVTAGGDIVWDYFNPHLNKHDRRAVIVRLYRYEAEMVEPLLKKFGVERK